MNKPHLKLIACHRGAEARAVLKRAVVDHVAKKIPVGPLRGCLRARAGPTPFRVYLAPKRADWVLEMVLCIRIRLEEYRED